MPNQDSFFLPQSPSTAANPVVQTRLKMAQAFHQNGNLDEAEALYQKVIELDPGNADGFHMRGVIAAQKGNYLLASQQITRAIALDPCVAAQFANLAAVQLRQGQLEAALASYQQAIALQPDDTPCISNVQKFTGD
jgi:Flp pilus assembly protein TadD